MLMRHRLHALTAPQASCIPGVQVRAAFEQLKFCA
jgi:hypothetical protein